MKPTYYLAIAVRLFSILLFIYGLKQSSYLIALASGAYEGVPSPSIAISVAATFAPIIISLLLWHFPMIAAKSLLKPEVDVPIEPMSNTATLTVILLGIGLYLFFYSMSDSIYWLTYWQITKSVSNFDLFTLQLTEQKAGTITTILELIASIIIIFKAKTISAKLLEITK